jgi:hypothetical protein
VFGCISQALTEEKTNANEPEIVLQFFSCRHDFIGFGVRKSLDDISAQP